MKKIIIALGLALATVSAHAQTAKPVGGDMRYIVGIGLTAGGDDLATAYYQKGGSVDIEAGGGVVFTTGIDYRVNSTFSFQGTVNFHVDDTNAKNGSIKFQRFPIEVAAYVHPAQWLRIGGGVRYVSSPKLSSSGVASGIDARFDNTVSPMVEAEYLWGDSGGIKLRYVSEKYKLKNSNIEIDGNHVGIFANYYF